MLFHILLTEWAREELNSAWGLWVPRRRSNLRVLEKIHAFQHIGMCDTCVFLELQRTAWDLIYDMVTEKLCQSEPSLAERGCILGLMLPEQIRFCERFYRARGNGTCHHCRSLPQTAIYRNLNYAKPRFLLQGRYLGQSQKNLPVVWGLLCADWLKILQSKMWHRTQQRRIISLADTASPLVQDLPPCMWPHKPKTCNRLSCFVF